jgi:O-methyltransferase involved in polyketide biosynthesis
MKLDLSGVEETLLVPLWGRAKFSRENPSILSDTKAIELVEQLDYDFARLDKSLGVLGNLMHASFVDHGTWRRKEKEGKTPFTRL